MNEINSVDNRSPIPPVLEFRFRIDAEITEGIPIDRRASGALEFIPITGGAVAGAIGGRISSGGDWCVNRGDGTWRVEARYGITLGDGAYVDVHNVGICDESHSGEGDYFVTTPVFRTAAVDHDWLNRSVFVGHAQELPGVIRIDVFEVTLAR